jgi:multiple sugar transport system permease protein
MLPSLVRRFSPRHWPTLHPFSPSIYLNRVRQQYHSRMRHLIPSFYLFSRILDWVNTYKVLIIPGVVDAYGIFLLTQYMKGIPSELLDAARIDGAGPLRIFWKVVVPLSRPVLGTLAIFKFLLAWNDYLWPLVMIRQESMYTLTIGIAQMQVRQGMVVEGVQMAASVIATVPVLLLVFAMQRQFLRGITTGAIKG